MFVFGSSSVAITAVVVVAIAAVTAIALLVSRRPSGSDADTSIDRTTAELAPPVDGTVESEGDAAGADAEPAVITADDVHPVGVEVDRIEDERSTDAIAAEHADAPEGVESAWPGAEGVVSGHDADAANDESIGDDVRETPDGSTSLGEKPDATVDEEPGIDADAESNRDAGAGAGRTHPDVLRFVEGLRLRPAPVTDLVAETTVGRMTRVDDRLERFPMLAGIDGDVDRTLLQRTCAVEDEIGWISMRVSPGVVGLELVELVEATLSETGRAPETLMIDVPADGSLSRKVIDTLTGLSDLGVHIGIHGFGADLSVLMEYGMLPLSYVSVDHAELARVGEHGERIIRLLHQLSHDLGFDPIAINPQPVSHGERIHRFVLDASADVAAPAPRRKPSALHPDFTD